MGTSRKHVWYTTAILISATALAFTSSIPTAAGSDTCDLTLTTHIVDNVANGELLVTITPGPQDLFTHTISSANGHTFVWADGTFPVTTQDDGTQIGGGTLSKEPVLVGVFTTITACFTANQTTTTASAATTSVRTAAPPPAPKPRTLGDTVMINGSLCWQLANNLLIS